MNGLTVEITLKKILFNKLIKVKKYVFDELGDGMDYETNELFQKFFNIPKNIILKDVNLENRENRGIFADWLATLEPICEYCPAYQRLSEYVFGRELFYDWERGEDL